MTRFAALALWICLSRFAVASAAVVSNTVTVPPSNCTVPAYNITTAHAHLALSVTRVESFEGHCSNDRILCATLQFSISKCRVDTATDPAHPPTHPPTAQLLFLPGQKLPFILG